MKKQENISKSDFFEFLNNNKTGNKFSTQELNKIIEKAYNMKSYRISTQKLIEKWLEKFDSKYTKRSFSENLNYFIDWIGNKNILDVDAGMVDSYVIYLKKLEILSDNTIRQRIAACSSFWKNLIRWDIVSKNYFLGASIPKKELAMKSSKSVPTNIQLNKIENYLRNQIRNKKGKGYRKKISGAKKTLAALIIMRVTGIRVGALNSFSIDKCYYTAKSKGGSIFGNIPYSTVRQIKKLGFNIERPFKNFNSFSKNFNKIIKELGFEFSIHGIRHRFAINFYKKYKDPVRLQEALGHKSLRPTTAYLSSLKIAMKK